MESESETVADLLYEIRQSLNAVKAILARKVLHKEDKEVAVKNLDGVGECLAELERIVTKRNH
jgi:phosphoglycerate-specific signal transduction histidine kinase